MTADSNGKNTVTLGRGTRLGRHPRPRASQKLYRQQHVPLSPPVLRKRSKRNERSARGGRLSGKRACAISSGQYRVQYWERYFGYFKHIRNKTMAYVTI